MGKCDIAKGVLTIDIGRLKRRVPELGCRFGTLNQLKSAAQSNSKAIALHKCIRMNAQELPSNPPPYKKTPL
ncbi:hypothetical protein R50072_13580 [Simiduia litorea]